MNELLQKHGCSNVFHIPEGLKELMADITREVLRAQPVCLTEFIADYLSALLITREHGLLSVKLLQDLCDCKPTINEHLLQLNIGRDDAEKLADIITEAIEKSDIEEGKEKVKETEIIEKILEICDMETEMVTKICLIARNAFRDYCHRKNLLAQEKRKLSDYRPWEIAAEHTVQIYKSTKPSFRELSRAAEKIQAAYRGYHTRRYLLQHLKPKPKEGPKKELPGPPLDIAGSREIDLGPVMEVNVDTTDDIDAMLDANARKDLNLSYDPNKVLPDGQPEVYSATDRLKMRPNSLKQMAHFQDKTEGQVNTPVSETNLDEQNAELKLNESKPGSILKVKQEKSDIIKEPVQEKQSTEVMDSCGLLCEQCACDEDGQEEKGGQLAAIAEDDNAEEHQIIDDDDKDN